MSDDAEQGTLPSSSVSSSSEHREGTTWYRQTDEANDGEEAEIDQDLFCLEGRQGAWWRIRWKGGAEACTPCRS